MAIRGLLASFQAQGTHCFVGGWAQYFQVGKEDAMQSDLQYQAPCWAMEVPRSRVPSLLPEWTVLLVRKCFLL